MSKGRASASKNAMLRFVARGLIARQHDLSPDGFVSIKCDPTGVSPMDSAQHCRDQAAECIRLIKSMQSRAEAEVLRNISASWSRLAGQIDRYAALVRDQGRIPREE
jgi:hypothetical protein